jgi:hypothetical protein
VLSKTFSVRFFFLKAYHSFERQIMNMHPGPRQRCKFTETNLARAIRGARRAGITAPRVDIAPDGTISISQLTPQEAAEAPKPAPETSEWDRALGKPPA